MGCFAFNKFPPPLLRNTATLSPRKLFSHCVSCKTNRIRTARLPISLQFPNAIIRKTLSGNSCQVRCRFPIFDLSPIPLSKWEKSLNQPHRLPQARTPINRIVNHRTVVVVNRCGAVVDGRFGYYRQPCATTAIQEGDREKGLCNCWENCFSSSVDRLPTNTKHLPSAAANPHVLLGSIVFKLGNCILPPH